jgi:hypothetical protein
MPIIFVKHNSKRPQLLLMDSNPDDLYYNPSTKTLHADNFSGGIPSLIEGEAIQLTTSNNSTTIDVNFDKNTASTTSISANDKILIQDGLDFLKTISGANLRESLKPTEGTNLSYGSGVNSNTLNLDGSITSTTLSTNCVWNGNLILAPKLSDGSVSDAEFQRLNGITSAILETSDKGAANGVCPLSSSSIIPTQYLPSSVNDIIEVANFSALPTTGESSKIYVTLDNHKAYRWGGTDYVEISASLVLGTTAGTAYDGASGQTNADNIALKQPILLDSATSGILIDGSNNIDIDMTRTTAETTFDDNELMLIQKSNGNLCRLTKQQLKSSINTNTEYNNGSNITIDGSNNINLDTTLENVNSIESSINTDLKIESNGTGDILLIATPNTSTIGYIHLARADDTTQRFNTIAYNTDGNNSYINFLVHYTAGSNNLTRQVLKLNSDLNADFSGNINIATGKTYKIDGTDLSGANLNYSAGVTINTEIDSKQDILTFGKSSGNALKLEADVASNDVLLMGSSNVIGKTYSELKSLLSLNNVENIAVSSLGGTNLTYTNNKLNLDTTLEDVNSIESETNTDLKLSSSGTGNILLKGNVDYQTIGKIHLARMDNDAIRFNTIEYSNNFNNAYIKFLIHRSGGDNTLTREVLKLNSNLSAEFAGNVTVNTIESSTNTDLQLESNGTGDILLIAAPNTSTIGYIHLARADAPNQRFNTISYSTSGNNSYIALNVHYTAGANDLTRQVLKLNSNLTASFAGNVGIGNESPTQALDVTGSIYASLNLDCTALTGGRNNLTDDFYIGNYTNSGAMYMNYSNQQNIQIGKDYLSLFDLSNGTIKKVVQQTGTGYRAIMDFFRKASATSSEIAVGRIECNSTNTFYRTDPSDIRLKEYIKDIENHFDILDKLKPCNFKYKSCDEIRDGFIADDLYKSYPICTSGKPGELNEDGSNKYMMIDTKPLIPILTKCIQGNRQEIKDLKNKVDELELKLDLIMKNLNL